MPLAERNIDALAERLGAPVASSTPEAALLGPDTLRGLGLMG